MKKEISGVWVKREADTVPSSLKDGEASNNRLI
jgi:hypothetical protein